MLQLGIRTQSNVALSDRAEVDPMLGLAERDRARFLKGRLVGERDLR